MQENMLHDTAMVCEPYNKMFCANLIMPNGYRNGYSVSARNKTEARKRIAELYREDNGPKSAGFYSFAQGRLFWIEEA
jgi:hypothetical protein